MAVQWQVSLEYSLRWMKDIPSRISAAAGWRRAEISIPYTNLKSSTITQSQSHHTLLSLQEHNPAGTFTKSNVKIDGMI